MQKRARSVHGATNLSVQQFRVADRPSILALPIKGVIAVTDLEALERAWEVFGESTTAVIDILAIVARDRLGWGGTLEDAVTMFQGCQRYNVYQHTGTGRWHVRRLT